MRSLLQILAAFLLVSSVSAAEPVTMLFDIPAGPAEQALKAFSVQSGHEVLFATATARRSRTNPVRGNYTATDALGHLLKDTGLVATRDDTSGVISVTRDPNASRTARRAASDRPTNSGSGQDVRGSSVDTADDVVKLTAFEVTGAKLEEYLPAEAAGGTRYASQISELPFAVQVITSEFIEDFQVLEYEEALATTSSMSNHSGLQGTGAFILRGIRVTGNTHVDGIPGGELFGPQSTDRIEVIKGSNVSIYGQTGPTGVVNRVTKQAHMRPQSRFSVSAGSHDLHRASFDVNRPLIDGKLAVRLAGGYDYTEAISEKFRYSRRLDLFATARYNISDRTTFNAKINYLNQRQEVGLPAPVVRTGNQNVGILGLGEYKEWYGINVAGPESVVGHELTVTGAELFHKFNDVLSMRAYGSYQYVDQRQFRIGGGGTVSDATWRVANRTARTVLGLRDAYIGQLEFLAEFKTKALDHKAFLALDYRENINYAQQFNRTALMPSLDIHDPVYYDIPIPSLASVRGSVDRTIFNQAATDRTNYIVTRGLFLSDRITVKDRVFLLGGIRFDEITSSQSNRLAPDTSKTFIDRNRDTTYQSGLLFKLTNNLSAYASYSESYLPQAVGRIGFNGLPLDNIRGSGMDAGVKASLMDYRMHFTLGVYSVDIDNLSRNATDDSGARLRNPNGELYFVAGAQRSRGIEFDYNWTIVKGLNIFGSYAYIDAAWMDVPDQRHLPPHLQLTGLTPGRNPKHVAFFGGKVGFDRWGMDRLQFRYGVRYQAKHMISETLRDPNGVHFYNPPQTVVDCGFTYSWRARDRGVGHRIDLNIKNLGDKEYLASQMANRNIPRSFIVSYSLRK